MEKELIIHLGLPKTGTTALQNRIFPYHPEYLYLGKFNTPEAEKNWILPFKRSLVSKDIPFFVEYELEEVLQNEFGEKYNQYDKLFLSEESILGRCIGPGKYGDLVRVGSAYSIFSKLKILFDNSSFASLKLILVLRKQDDMIESFFAEEYHNFKFFFGMESPREFADHLFTEGQGEEADSLFRYHSLIKSLDSLFGKKNVLVLPYEKLKTDPEGFLSEFSAFMQIAPWENTHLLREKKDNNRDAKRKAGKVAKVQSLRKKIAQLKSNLIGDIPTGLGRRFNFLDKLQKNKIVKLDSSHKEKILLHYAEENRQLENRVKFISEFGYY